VSLQSVLAGLDWAQLTVAAMATGSYATTSIVVQRVYAARRRRRAWLEARFVSRLIERAGSGSVQTLTDIETLYRDTGMPFDSNHHRLELLIDRARTRLRRRGERSRSHGHPPALDSRRRHAADVLDRLSSSCRLAWMDDLIRTARVSADDVERIRIEAVRESAALAEGARHGRKRRARQRRTAAMVWRGVIGAGCIGFVQIALVVWHSWQ
jgi:hypothetical protein